ncbi:DUF503 domain-containing protein [Pelotomaculum isophthalicicum JI]|uniref:DUF503 domain-containing protein n=1 Tax=Pelotomaculum isophthalicicum JI TaxID=947010 RepID=A0A9X4H3T6_9FIRM|nr:DUF503 family protein [Pelotomaculum isophthalicicum]MDF9409331.1 DUF503 domain-containing protein [Pelotomaculum isophthalicicum JI]
MVVGVLTIELFIGEAHSLKEKRRVLKSVIMEARGRSFCFPLARGKQKERPLASQRPPLLLVGVTDSDFD